MMNRNKMLKKVKASSKYDVIVIGGGASGLGAALDSTLRGYKTLLLEKYDFAKGTSSKSTKLAHGGVRYLKQGDVGMVREALRERGLMKENAPHLVHDQKFIVPIYEWWDAPFYTTGLKVYDVMSGSLGLGPSEMISKEKTLQHIPTLNQEGLIGGVRYYDGQFDDARFAMSLALTIADYGGEIINYAGVIGLRKNKRGRVRGVKFLDAINKEEIIVKSKMVINATGVFVDEIMKLDDANHENLVAPSQGVHVVLDADFLQGESSIMVPRTSDGRVLFAVPWYNKTIVGTTDTSIEKIDIEPKPLEEEINFILKTASQYLVKSPKRSDVKSVYVGLRPLVKKQSQETKNISRSHKIVHSDSSLITIIGGKWTTYRQMAEDAIDYTERIAGWDSVKCMTKEALLHGFLKNVDRTDVRSVFGKDLDKIQERIDQNQRMSEALHEDLPYLLADIEWVVKNEMALNVEDVLSRRTRCLLLNARASIEVAPKVAKIMAEILGKNKKWQKDQVESFKRLAEDYILF